VKRESPLLLKQVRVLDPAANSDRLADVLFADGKVVAVEPELAIPTPETAVIEAAGCILAPGLADLYSHSGDPGYEDRETLASLATAAAAGGFTRLAVLPDTAPPTDNSAALQSLQQQSQALRETGLNAPRLDFWSALTLKREGQQMVELVEMAAAGAIGFTDSRPLENLGLLRRVLEYLQPLDKPLALVPANLALRGNGVLREGIASIRYGLPGDAAASETAALAAILEVIAATECPAHLMRISTQRGVALVAEAKARGLPVTASTTWMHLLLDAAAAASYDPNLRLTPPLGNEEDRLALIAGVAGGIIDVIAVDHAPYTYEEKAVGFAEAPSGAIGLELVLPLLWQEFVASGQWTAGQLWQALSVNPRACLQQPPIRLASGQPIEAILFDPHQVWTVERGTIKSLSANSFWWGKQLVGRVLRTWISEYTRVQ
jgi:dihydroorotase